MQSVHSVFVAVFFALFALDATAFAQQGVTYTLCDNQQAAACSSCTCDAEQPTAGLPQYSGDLLERSFFTGDWLGGRSRLAQNGITFTGDVTNYYQGVVNGGRRQTFRYGGHSDYIFDLDMDKVAGAEGMLIRVRGESQFGEFVNRDTGAILATNTSGLFPTIGEQKTALTEFTITQFVSETVGLFAGKVQTMDGDLNAFAHGRGKNQFMNVAFVGNPAVFRTVPYSSWGFGIVVIGQEQTPVFSITAIDPVDRATTFDLDDAFEEGVSINVELRLPTNFGGKPGHQLFGGVWSERDVALLSQGPRLLLPNVMTPTSPDSWVLYWNFDQYLFVDPCDETKGWGAFGRAAVADDATNPVDWFISFGFGGNSTLPGRSNDTWGIGAYHAAVSDQLPGVLLGGDGTGGEMFYNRQVTPWFYLTGDVQYMNPGVNNVEDSWLVGMRAKVDF